MKTLFACSITLNLLFIFLSTIAGKGQPRKDEPKITPPVANREVASRVIEKGGFTNTSVTNVNWKSVESVDYQQYITNLRSIGCPEETIRDIVRADVQKLFQQRLQKALPPAGPYQYWKPIHPFAAFMSPERLSKTKEIQEEQNAVLSRLLGSQMIADEPFAQANPYSQLLPFLGNDQLAQVAKIRDDYKAEMMQSQNMQLSPDERRKLSLQAEDKMEQQLSSSMSRDQKEDYDLRLSNTANKMREHLAAFEPTETEFKSIFRARKEYEASIHHLDQSETNSETNSQQLETRFLEQVRSALPPLRFQTFLQVINK